MKSLNLSPKARRFLVIWISIHILALFSNFANLDWKYENCKERFKEGSIYYFFTHKNINVNPKFWPFVKFTETENRFEYISWNQYGRSSIPQNVYTRYEVFNGLFYDYSYPEFFIYITLPFIIIFLRKLWQ